MSQIYYTVSTQIFKTKKEAEAKVLQWAEADQLVDGSLIFEVTKIWKPKVKSVVVSEPYAYSNAHGGKKR